MIMTTTFGYGFNNKPKLTVRGWISLWVRLPPLNISHDKIFLSLGVRVILGSVASTVAMPDVLDADLGGCT